MHHTRSFLCLLTTMALLVACQQRPPADETATMEEPVVDVAAEVEAINQTADRYEQAIAAKDVEALVAFYTDDAIWIAPDGTPTSGANAFRESLTETTSQPGTVAMEITPDRTVVASSGDLAYTIGTYTVTTTAPDGETVQEGHRYVVGLEKVGGEWKVDFVMESSPLVTGSAAPVGSEAPANP